MAHALLNADGVIANLIVAPAGEYAAPAGLALAEVPEYAVIGDRFIEGELIAQPMPARTLAELKAIKKAAIDARKDAILIGGYHPTHPALADQVLQNRPEDRDNWNMALDMAKDAVLGGLGAVADAPFRTAGNVTIKVTFAEAVAVLQAFRKWGLDVLAVSWALKDACEAAGSEAALDLVDIDAAYASVGG